MAKPKRRVTSDIKSALRSAFNAGVMSADTMYDLDCADAYGLDPMSDTFDEDIEDAIFEEWFDRSFKVIDAIPNRRIQNNPRPKGSRKVVCRTSN